MDQISNMHIVYNRLMDHNESRESYFNRMMFLITHDYKYIYNTIKKYDTSLLPYHRPEDMVEIPIYIMSLISDYRMYIRHHSNENGEMVLYCI